MSKEYEAFVKVQTGSGGVFGGSSQSMLSRPEAIRNLFRDTNANASEIANAMYELWKTNGIVAGTIRYFRSHLTFNHSIYPTMSERSGYDMPSDPQEYYEMANFTDRFNIKYFAPYFVQQMLLNGVVYLYEISDNNHVGYIEFPAEWGRVKKSDQGLLRWEVDISRIREDSPVFPNEIRKAYEDMQNGSTDSDRWRDNKWFTLSDKGFALTLDHNIMKSGVAVSELANILLDSSTLENAKANIEIKDNLDTVKIVHSKVPTDNQGKVKMSKKLVDKYNDQVNRALPKGVVSIASPLDMTNISLGSAGDKSAYEMVEKAQKQFFLSTGTPANLFGGETSSSRIVETSISKDAFWLYTDLLPVLENYYNYRLQKQRTQSGMNWKIKFLRQSYYTLKDDTEKYQRQLERGGSRLDYLAATGMTPAEVVGKLRMEQEMLDIDSIMLPKQTSHTMSSNSGSSDGESQRGRPETDSPTEDTERLRDRE